MADMRPVRRLSVGLPREDFQWLAGFARQENASAAEVTGYAVWLLRQWEETIKGTIVEVLDNIDALCREHDQEIAQLRHYYERRQGTPPRAEHTAPHDARIGKLLGLAISTNSEGEATAAFAKARALHRPTALAGHQ